MRAVAMALVAVAVLSGCQNVQPWERDLLAEPAMIPGEANGLDTAYDEHIYYSEEASSGGRGFGGARCGCN